MKTISIAEVTADLKAVCESVARRVPPERDLARRIGERADEVRADLRREGPLEVAVDLLRESRDK